MSEPTASAIVVTGATRPRLRTTAIASITTDACGALDVDPRAVGQHRVQRLARQPGQRLQRPGDDPHVVEAAEERGLGEVPGFAGVAADHRIGAHHDHQPVRGLLEVHDCHPFQMWDVGEGPDGGRTVVPQSDGEGPRDTTRWPGRWSSVLVIQLRSSGRPSSVTDCTYCAGSSSDPRCRSTASMTKSPPAPRRVARSKAGALTNTMLCPATGNRPSEAQTYHELRPPESSLPARPPRPGPKAPPSTACTTSAVRSGRPT